MKDCNTDNSLCSATAAEEHLGDILLDVFGVTFELTPHRADDPPECQNADCDGDCDCRNGIFIETLGNNEWNLKIAELPVDKDTVDASAVDASAVVAALSREAVVRSARAAVKQTEQQTMIEYLDSQRRCFLEQVSGDLEEACWFRILANHVAACRADDPPELLCQRIMPQLRNLLDAKTLLLLQDLKAEDGQYVADNVVAIESELQSVEDIQRSAIDLVSRLREQATGQAIIVNTRFSKTLPLSVALPETIREMVLVRVGTQAQHFGWLIAMGRRESSETGANEIYSEAEFGTHEATLMETAAVMLATHAANSNLFDEQEQTLVGVVKAMVNALDARDPYTCGHSDRVARICKCIAEQLKLSETECEDIYLAGLLHDIGKIGVPDHVLLKDGPLEHSERDLIVQHPLTGHAILSPVPQLSKILPGVLYHHERVDGAGYPEKLRGKTIPLSARILAVADTYDALITCRPYRNGMSTAKAEQILLEGANKQWDADVLEAFFAAIQDIRNVYTQDSGQPPIQDESILQQGRFEDECRSISNSHLQCDVAGR